SWSMSDHYVAASLVITLIVMLCQLMMGSYLSWRGRPFLQQLGRIYSGWLLALAAIASMAVIFKVAEIYSRLWLMTTLAIALALVTAVRLIIYLSLRQLRTKGGNLKKVIVIESGAAGAPLHAREAELPEHGYKVVCTLAL